MRRLPSVRILVGALLVGSAALAQQGLIVEPWRPPEAHATSSSSPGARPVLLVERRTMPASGLPAAPRVALPKAPEPVASEAPWRPPVVALLVDPWAKPRRAVVATERHWEPRAAEIVDPWAHKPRPTAALPARAKPASHSPIF